MIIDNIIGNINHLSSVERQQIQRIEKVSMENDQLVKRVQRVITDQGREIGIHFPDYTELKKGDILYQDANLMIVVDVLPQSVIMIKPRSMREMGVIAHQLGNRHLPAQFVDQTMIVQEDRVTRDFLDSYHIPYERQMKKMEKPFLHIGHHHG